MKSNQPATCRRGYLLWLTAVVLIAISGFGQAEPVPWLILVSGEKGSINAHTNINILIDNIGCPECAD